MRRTDITGQPLPTLIVSGYNVYPPNLRTVKEAARLSDIMQSCIHQQITTAELSEFYSLLSLILSSNEENKEFTVKELLKCPFEDAVKVTVAYAEFINKLQSGHPLPQIHTTDDADFGYKMSLSFDKLVADFANISISDVQLLNYADYLILRREALIYMFSKTEEGREMLQDAYCFEQTEPDRAGLRSIFGGADNGKE